MKNKTMIITTLLSDHHAELKAKAADDVARAEAELEKAYLISIKARNEARRAEAKWDYEIVEKKLNMNIAVRIGGIKTAHYPEIAEAKLTIAAKAAEKEAIEQFKEADAKVTLAKEAEARVQDYIEYVMPKRFTEETKKLLKK